MLDKIESAYLAILRVVVLLAATIAMVVVVIGVAMAAPAIISRLQAGETPVEGGSLRSFIEAQKSASPELSDVTVGGDQVSAASLNPDLEAAAQLLHKYLTKRVGMTVELPWVRNLLTEQMQKAPALHADAYAKSLRKLFDQLDKSTGAPLSAENIDALVTWHDERFQAEIARREADEASRLGGATVGFVAAGVGFITFLLLVYFFVFVKIERNLRLVHTKETTAG